MKNLNLIEKYLNEELSTTERLEFDRLQKEDAAFAEEVQAAVVLNADFNVQQKLRWQKLVTQKETIRETPVRRLPMRQLRSIAAVIVFGLAVAMGWIMFGGSDMNELANAHLEQKHIQPTVTRLGFETSWVKASELYEDGKYPQAILLIEKIIEGDIERVEEKHFYLGLSHLYAEVPNLEKAITHLQKSGKLNPHLYGLQANWYMSLAHLKSNNIEEAEVLLQEVANAAGWKSKEATALLNKL